MRTVLRRSTGSASFTLAVAGVVGSAAFPVVPALAGVVSHHTAMHGPSHAHRAEAASDVRLAPAVKYLRDRHGRVHRVR